MALDTFVLVVGHSGSGKTRIVEEFEKIYGCKSLQSYTTRPPRYEGETGHIFVSVDDMPSEEEMVGYTCYNGNHYWATQNQVLSNDFYVIDTEGISYFREHYKGKKPYIVLNISATEDERRERMLARGDTEEKVNERIELDRVAFAKIDADVVFENHNLEECINEIATYLGLKN